LNQLSLPWCTPVVHKLDRINATQLDRNAAQRTINAAHCHRTGLAITCVALRLLEFPIKCVALQLRLLINTQVRLLQYRTPIAPSKNVTNLLKMTKNVGYFTKNFCNFSKFVR
jgi:hypothetical protein